VGVPVAERLMQQSSGVGTGLKAFAAAGPGMPGHCPGELPLNKKATIIALCGSGWLGKQVTSATIQLMITLINSHQGAILYVRVKVHFVGS